MRSLCVTGASTTLDFHPLVALNQPRLFTLAHLHPHPGLLVTLLIIASSSSLPPLYSLKEGLHVRNVNIKYEAYLSKCQLSHRSGVFLFFYYDLMRSYRTITYTNNNFITLALAVITVSAQCLTYTNSSDKAPGEVRFSNLSFASFYVNIVFSIMNSS